VGGDGISTIASPGPHPHGAPLLSLGQPKCNCKGYYFIFNSTIKKKIEEKRRGEERGEGMGGERREEKGERKKEKKNEKGKKKLLHKGDFKVIQNIVFI
jgi:hypothetical protein